MAKRLMELSDELANAVEHVGKSTVAVKEGGRVGVSGTVWRKDVVVAAEHTIRGRPEVTVVLPSGETAVAAVIGRDPTTDVAALKLNAVAHQPEFADPASLRPGNIVFAVGRRVETGLNAAFGVVRAVSGAWRTWRGGRIDQALRLDLEPFTGFSGGPLIDAAGRILGINTSGPRGAVLTIPKATVDRVLQGLLSKGRIARPFVGIGGQPVMIPSALCTKLKLDDNRGVLVVVVEEGGPAEKAGVTVGDIIVSIGNTRVSEPSDLLAALDPEAVGKPLRVRVLRGGVSVDVDVIVGERGTE